MFLSIILTLIVAIFLVIATVEMEFMWTFTFFGYDTDIPFLVYSLGAILVGVLLVAFIKVDGKRALKTKNKSLQSEVKQKDQELTEVKSNLSQISTSLTEKTEEVSRLKEELLVALKKGQPEIKEPQQAPPVAAEVNVEVVEEPAEEME